MNWIVMSEWNSSIPFWQPLTMQPILTHMRIKFSFLNLQPFSQPISLLWQPFCKPILNKAGHPLTYFTCMWIYKLFHPTPPWGLTSLTPERWIKLAPFGCQMSLSELKKSFVFGSSSAGKAAPTPPTGNHSESFSPQRKEGSATGWISLS